MIRNQQILVAILNWGLGHATRSIPIIEGLIDNGNRVTIASDGAALHLLKSVFNSATFLELPGYNVTYPSDNMIWNIGIKIPTIWKAITEERQVIERWVAGNSIDLIISDNRYGCHHPSVKNIFVSHQLNLQVPMGSLVNRAHARLIDPFEEVWVVDDSSRKLSGTLSDPKWLSPAKVIKFIGAQSRLQRKNSERNFEIAVILSGPEPQRTYLEKELYQKLAAGHLRSIIVQGNKDCTPLASTSIMKVESFADKDSLSEIICGSQMIICRSGYSSIMDLAHLGGKALLVPTPGQTEQIYLAERLFQSRVAQIQHQGQIDIQRAWEMQGQFSGF